MARKHAWGPQARRFQQTLAGVVILTGAVAGAHADTLLVPVDYVTIQAAIDAAADGDTVLVADGTYTGVGNKNLDFQAKAITLGSETGNRDQCIIDCENDGRFATFGAGDTAVVESITIQNGNTAVSGGAALLTAGCSPSFIDCVFQDCQADSRGGALALVGGASVTINGCAFQGNQAVVNGGGIDISGGETTIGGCTFTGNFVTGESRNGGGLLVGDGARLTCTDSSFTANSCTGGGAGIVTGVVDPASRISGCQFTNNVAAKGGGGIAIKADFPEISNCVFQGNVAFAGGGLNFFCCLGTSTTRVENVLFLNNTAFFGGGVEVNPDNSPEFVNCLFAGNSAIAGGGFPASGGAIDIFGSTPTMINCTFSGNSSEEFGGAVTVSNGGDLGLVNCVLWGNEAPFGAEIRIGYPDFGSGTVTVSYSDVAGGEVGVSNDGGTLNWGAGNIERDPLFVDPDGPDNDPDTYEDNDYRLGAGSQAIDAAYTAKTALPPNDVDLDGNPRRVDDPDTEDCQQAPGDCGECPVVDMGAYEYQDGTTECCGGCPTDVNDDGETGPFDLATLLAAWGPVEPGNCLDADGNGDMGPFDLATLLAGWGPCP